MSDRDILKEEKILIRMILLLSFLEKSDNLEYCASSMRVSVRTLERDIKILRKAGFPLAFNQEKNQCRVESATRRLPFEFSQIEILGLLALLDADDDTQNRILVSSARVIAMKISLLLSPQFYNLFVKTPKNLSILPASSNFDNLNQEHFETLLAALEQKEILFIRYRGASDSQPIETLLNVYSILHGRSSWYVIGFCNLFHEVRTFKINRILDIKKTNAFFTQQLEFSIEKYLGNAWYMIPGREQDYDILIRFSRKVASNVTEVCWHRTQEIRKLSDGRVDLRFRVSGLSEIIWWILGYGAEAEVLEPPELRDMVKDHLNRWELLYQD